MLYKVEFKDLEDREKKIKEHSDKFLIEIQDITEGKFLIFTNEKPLTEQINEQMDYLVDVDFRLSMVELGLV